MDDVQRYLAEQLADEEFRAAWEQQAAERMLMCSILDAREQEGLTQSELARRCGMRQGNLSRIECGAGNPSLSTLQRIAHGLGRELVIEFRKRSVPGEQVR